MRIREMWQSLTSVRTLVRDESTGKLAIIHRGDWQDTIEALARSGLAFGGLAFGGQKGLALATFAQTIAEEVV